MDRGAEDYQAKNLILSSSSQTCFVRMNMGWAALTQWSLITRTGSECFASSVKPGWNRHPRQAYETD